MTTSIQACRERFAREVVGDAGGAIAARLVDAFAHVARERFVGEPPWPILDGAGYVPTRCADPRLLYEDVLVGLAPERGINNGQPSLHARCLAACAPAPGESVVHIGAGTGYYTAILAALVGSAGSVVAYEIELDLADAARRNLAHLTNVTVLAASATDAALPSADVIYVCAGATHPLASWLDALNVGGRLTLPLTTDDGHGFMLMVTRRGADAYAAAASMRVGFIACIGARDAAASKALDEALAARSIHSIRSLRRGTPPDRSAWCVGAGWWLSTSEPD